MPLSQRSGKRRTDARNSKRLNMKSATRCAWSISWSSAFPEDVFPRTIEHAKGFFGSRSKNTALQRSGRSGKITNWSRRTSTPCTWKNHFAPLKSSGLMTWWIGQSLSSKAPDVWNGFWAALHLPWMLSILLRATNANAISWTSLALSLHSDRFTDEDELVSASIDRFDENYGRSFQPRRPLPSNDAGISPSAEPRPAFAAGRALLVWPCWRGFRWGLLDSTAPKYFM